MTIPCAVIINGTATRYGVTDNVRYMIDINVKPETLKQLQANGVEIYKDTKS